MLNLHITSKFKKQLKNYQYNGKVMQRLEQCGEEILSGTIDEKRKDHQLSGKFLQYREVHLFPDVLMIYYIEGEDCFFVAIGSHADLFW